MSYLGLFDLANDSLKGPSKIVPAPSITDSRHSGSTIPSPEAGLRLATLGFPDVFGTHRMASSARLRKAK
jgi:hypothetical protein